LLTIGFDRKERCLLRNTANAWGWPAIVLHWLGAAAVLVLLVHGWWMTHMIPASPERLANYSWHAALGYDLLVVMVLRLLWRWSGGVPALPVDSRRWERLAANLGHALLYLFTFAATFVGWALAGTMRTPLAKDLFGISFPLIYTNHDRAAHELLEDTHKILAYLVAVIIAAHIAGALRHHFIKRNNMLRRMLRPVAASA
jgi:cytochrome b561